MEQGGVTRNVKRTVRMYQVQYLRGLYETQPFSPIL